jgi:hypothetical protein
VPQNRPYIAPPFQQAQDDVFGGGPVPGAQGFLANLNFQDGNAAPQLTPDSVILAREHLAQLQHPLEFNLAPAPAGRRQPQFSPGNRVNAIAGPSNLQDIPPAAPKARDSKPGFPDLLWCTSGKHYRHQQLFEDNATCSECCEKNRRKAQIAAERRAEAQRQAQQQAQLAQQIPLDEEMPGPDEPLNPPLIPPIPPPPVDPMAQPAVLAADKLLMDRVRLELMIIESIRSP